MKRLVVQAEARTLEYFGRFVPKPRVGKAGAIIVVMLVVWLLSIGLFYVWTRMQVLQVGYLIADLEKKNKSLQERKRELSVEIASLESPGELESEARHRAGLVAPSMDKVVHVP